MLSLRTLCRLPITPTRASSHLLLINYSSVLQRSRGIHDISLPMCSEDTVYTRSTHAVSRKQAQAQMEIVELRHKVRELGQAVEKRDAVAKEKDALVKERDATIKERDAIIRDLKLNIVQQRGIIQQLEHLAQGMRDRDGGVEDIVTAAVDKQGVGRAENVTEGRTAEARKQQDRVRGADMLMELIMEMRESRREAYDPL